MSDTELKSRKKCKVKHWESAEDIKLMKEGALRTFLSIKDMLSSIELLEKNSSRRYKLIKYLILSGIGNLNHIVDYTEMPEITYKFEAGRLYVNGEEVDTGVLKK